MKIKNAFDEDIDLVVEGNSKSYTTIIFVHGFGTDKDEGEGLFVDLSSVLREYRIVRFDFTGYGKSGGKQEDTSLVKEASDLNSVLGFVREKYGNKIWLIGMSLGCYVIALLSPDGIPKTVFISPPDSSQVITTERLVKRIKSRKGGVVDYNGIRSYPRSSGDTQKIGPAFWKSLNEFNAEAAISAYSRETDLITIIPVQDEIFERKNMDIYDKVSSSCIRMKGNHAFTVKEDREALVSKVAYIFQSNQSKGLFA
jgi:pimeloyl-ACP methyl ester carboxylesterase